MTRRICLIAHGAKIDADQIASELEASDVDLGDASVVTRITQANGEAREWATQAAAEGVDRVIAFGGDGTLNEVVGGLLAHTGPRPALGVIPLGTANDFATCVEIPTTTAEALVLAIHGPPCPIDIGRAGDDMFLNVVSGGVMSKASAELNPTIKSLLGDLSYAMAGLLQLPSLEPVELELEGQDWRWSGSLVALGVGNARTVGGGFAMCPDASLTDGMLDVTIVPAGLELTELAAIVASRTVADHAGVVRFRSPWIRVEARTPLHFNADGEPGEVRDIDFGVEARALEVCIPLTAAALRSTSF